jgi:branched-chain amino acid transport system permease protein
MTLFLLAAVLLTLLALPFLLGPYPIVFLFLLFIYISLAAGYDLVGGHLGYINLGHAAFFGTGAYTFAIALARGLPEPLALPLAALGAAALAALVAFPLFRLRGVYFAIGSFGLVVLMRQLALNLGDLTNGVAGLSLPATYQPTLSYYLALALALATLAANFALARGRIGLAMACIREDEDAAAGTGIDTLRVKTAALLLSAVSAGLAGALYAAFLIFINPNSVFSLELTLVPVVMAMLGGGGTIVGPVLGALFVQGVQEVVWTNIPLFRSQLHLATFGVLLAAIGLLLPGGFARAPRARRWLRRAGLAGYG